MFSLIVDDIALLHGMKEGSQSSYESLYIKYFKDLCLFTQNYTRHIGKAEDIVQQVMLRVWENREKINIDSSLKSYLYRSCYNEFINSFKRAEKTSSLEEILIEAYEEIYDDEFEFDEKLKMVKSEIEKLPTRCREVFILCKLKGYKYKEAAKELNISDKTVEVQISIAMKRLKGIFGPEL